MYQSIEQTVAQQRHLRFYLRTARSGARGDMRTALLVVVAHAAALAAFCTAGSPGHAEVLHVPEEASECCVAKVTDLRFQLSELRAENTALRKNNQRLTGDLDECRAESLAQPLVWRLTAGNDHRDDDELSTREGPPVPPPPQTPALRRRKTLATPAPTPITPIPTTASPSATPSVSPVPTTEGITTYSQLANAVADPANSEVIVEADVAFPVFSAIVVDSERSVSVVGRSAVDGGRVVFDGAGHSQHFYVTGGTLHIAFVDLVNGTASQVETGCRPDLWKCAAGSILVTGGGRLVMRSCDVLGGGGPDVRNAYMAGGMMISDDDSTADFHNVTWSDLRAGMYIPAVYAQGSIDEEHAIIVNFYGCRILHNSAPAGAAVLIGWTGVLAAFYDCLFENNDGTALATWSSADVQIVRCTFRGNIGSGEFWPEYSAAVVLVPLASKTTLIFDSVFERNIGSAVGSSGGGGALAIQGATVLLSNTSFLANTVLNAGYGGGAFHALGGAKVTVIDSFALANLASQSGGAVQVDDSELTVINSK